MSSNGIVQTSVNAWAGLWAVLAAIGFIENAVSPRRGRELRAELTRIRPTNRVAEQRPRASA